MILIWDKPKEKESLYCVVPQSQNIVNSDSCISNLLLYKSSCTFSRRIYCFVGWICMSKPHVYGLYDKIGPNYFSIIRTRPELRSPSNALSILLALYVVSVGNNVEKSPNRKIAKRSTNYFSFLSMAESNCIAEQLHVTPTFSCN